MIWSEFVPTKSPTVFDILVTESNSCASCVRSLTIVWLVVVIACSAWSRSGAAVLYVPATCAKAAKSDVSFGTCGENCCR